jgi:hypothetical protein
LTYIVNYTTISPQCQSLNKRIHGYFAHEKTAGAVNFCGGLYRLLPPLQNLPLYGIINLKENVVIPPTHHKNSSYTELKVLGVYFPPAEGGGKIYNAQLSFCLSHF